jgi:hypothetical protein
MTVLPRLGLGPCPGRAERSCAERIASTAVTLPNTAARCSGIVAAVCRGLCGATALWQAQYCNVARTAEMRQTELHILSTVHLEPAQLTLCTGGGGARPAASRWQKPADPHGVPRPRWGTVRIMFIRTVDQRTERVTHRF